MRKKNQETVILKLTIINDETYLCKNAEFICKLYAKHIVNSFYSFLPVPRII